MIALWLTASVFAPPGDAQIDYAVDARAELLSVVFRVAQAEEYSYAKTDYAHEVDAYFGKFATHPIIAATLAAREKAGVSFNAPMALAVALDENLQLRAKPTSDDRWQNVDLADYTAKLRDFAKVSNFEKFFLAHQKYFDAVAARYKDTFAPKKIIPWFDNYFGAKPNARYRVAPGMLTGPCNYAASIALLGGREEIYQFVELGDLDAQALPRPNAEITQTLVHELAHSYVNPIVDAHANALKANWSALFTTAKDAMKHNAYGDWRSMTYESFTRAVNILFLRANGENDALASALQQDRKQNFPWTNALAGALQNHRFEDFMSKDAPAFPQHWHAHFSGPINSAVTGATIVKTEGLLAAYENQIAEKIHLPLASAEKWSDIKGNALLYGTHPLIRDVLVQRKIRITENGVDIAGKHFDGAHLVVIACAAKPDDDAAGVVVYAAAKDEDVVNINSVRHGVTDWLVAQNDNGKFSTLASGDF